MIQWTQAKVLVYSDSVLCLVKGMIAKVQLKDGKVKWENSKCLLLMKNCLESMEKQLNSSGIFSEDLRHRRFFKKSRMIYKSGTLNLRNSHTGSSIQEYKCFESWNPEKKNNNDT